MILLKLFFAFSVVGLFAFGGGYSTLSIMEELIVKKFSFLSSSEFWKIVGVAQITPGPIALNIATFVGAQKGKIVGAIISTFSVILFPSIFCFLLILIYKKTKDNEVIKEIFNSLQKMIPVLIAISLFSLFFDTISSIKYLIVLIISFIFIFIFPKFSILLKIIIMGFISILIYMFILP